MNPYLAAKKYGIYVVNLRERIRLRLIGALNPDLFASKPLRPDQIRGLQAIK
jgi:hypothetical protein